MKAYSNFSFILMLSIIISNAHPIPSLMLHPQEIDRVINKRRAVSIDTAPVVCKGIVYINNSNWTVWLGEIQVTPTSNPTNYRIESVSPIQITYCIQGQNQLYVACVGSPLLKPSVL